MVRRIFLILCCLGGCLSASAQQTLNLYTTTKGIISFTFAEQPKMSFPSSEVLAVTAQSVTLEFPYAEVQKMTFEDAANSVEKLTVSDGGTEIMVYDLTGKLVIRCDAKQGSASIDFSVLRPGVYVVKDGKRTYKVSKR